MKYLFLLLISISAQAQITGLSLIDINGDQINDTATSYGPFTNGASYTFDMTKIPANAHFKALTNTNIKRVRFDLKSPDGKILLQSASTNSPFNWSWTLMQGSYRVQADGYDSTGKYINSFWFKLTIPNWISPQALWVDDDGLQSVGLPKVYKTISDAINAAPAGGQVLVLPGTYAGFRLDKNLSIIAMEDTLHKVNPNFDPDNSSWPVIIKNATADAIQIKGSAHNGTISGLYVAQSEQADGGGIHAYGHGTPTNYTELCGFMNIMGNKIENTYSDGIKASQCTNLNVYGNLVNNFGVSEKKQGIDFVAVANSIVANNKVLKGPIGSDFKGGSINIKLFHNQFLGPFGWVAQSGEPSDQTAYIYYYSGHGGQYGLKYFLAMNNTFTGASDDVFIQDCQQCTYVNNTLTHNKIPIGTNQGINADICIQNSGTPAPEPYLTTSNCTLIWPQAIKVLSPWGWDMVPPGIMQ